MTEPHLIVPGLTSRLCRPGDDAFLRRLYRTSRDQDLAATGWSEAAKRDFCRQQFEAQRQDWTQRYPQAHWLLLLHRREPVGRVYYDDSGDEVRLIDVCLLPTARGVGRGSAILRALADLGRKMGKSAIGLSVEARNQRALALYVRQGYVEISRSPDRIQMRYDLSREDLPL